MESLYTDTNGINDNVYISKRKCENIICYNDLLPPLSKNGEIANIDSFNLSTFQPRHSFKIEKIQLHIQFTDRSYDLIEHTLKKTKQKEKERKQKKKAKESSKHQKSKNDLIPGLITSTNSNFNSNSKKMKNGHNGKKSKGPKPATTASSSASISTSISSSILNLPDLEPRQIHNTISEDSVSSMSQSVTPDHAHYNNHNHKKKNGKKRKLINNNLNGKNGHNHKNKRRKLSNNKLKIIDNDVIGDSDEDDEEIKSHSKTKRYKQKNKKNKHKKTTIFHQHQEEEDDDDDIEINEKEFKISHSLIYEITLDDFKFSFFLSLFPQLFVTHHLVYCQNSYKHYYYQNYFSANNNKYEWIQTDIQLMDIYHRYINNHFVSNDYNIINKHKYNDYKNRKIVLFFQIRPRSDTESDEETIEYHKQLLMDNLIQINEIRKNNSIQRHKNQKYRNQKRRRQRLTQSFDDETLFYMTNDDDDDNTDNDINMDNEYKSIYLNSSKQDIIYDNVIKEINSSHNNNDNDNNNNDKQETEKMEIERSLSIIPGSTESGVCGLCEKKFSTNKCTEQEWIQCEFCNKWYHVICSGLTMKQFAKFQDENDDTKEENKYKCLMCNKKE